MWHLTLKLNAEVSGEVIKVQHFENMTDPWFQWIIESLKLNPEMWKNSKSYIPLQQIISNGATPIKRGSDIFGSRRKAGHYYFASPPLLRGNMCPLSIYLVPFAFKNTHKRTFLRPDLKAEPILIRFDQFPLHTSLVCIEFWHIFLFNFTSYEFPLTYICSVALLYFYVDFDVLIISSCSSYLYIFFPFIFCSIVSSVI